MKRTTKGWQFELQWKDGTTSWMKMQEILDSSPVELAEYAVAADVFQPQMGQIENSPPITHHRRDLRKMSYNGLTNRLQGTQLE
eukprot:scaffold57589_cov62-Attheya_sp.AAC.1